MRHIARGAAPACLATETPEATAVHRGRYAELRYPSGEIRPLWNDLEKDEHGVGAVRRALLAMSDGECAYCGLHVDNDQMQVDHILPKKCFELLAYAWANLLPSCGGCNRRKLEFFPEPLRGKVIVERSLREHIAHDLVFDKDHIFLVLAVDHRLIDPTFDDPAEHLELLMDVPDYRPKSAVGRTTYQRLFARRREITANLAKVKQAARVSIEGTCSDAHLEDFATVCGYPSLFRRFVAHWRAERDAGHLAPPPSALADRVPPGNADGT
jgi:HNH endonuclease